MGVIAVESVAPNVLDIEAQEAGMRRASLLVMMGILAIAPVVRAEETFPFTVEGTILLPNPATKVAELGLTEAFNPCGQEDPDFGDLNGVDGYWIEIPDGAEGRRAVMLSDAVDMDVWFYTDCSLLEPTDAPDAYDMAQDLTGNETGTIPVGAAFAVVDLVLGANATFTFTIE